MALSEEFLTYREASYRANVSHSAGTQNTNNEITKRN